MPKHGAKFLHTVCAVSTLGLALAMATKAMAQSAEPVSMLDTIIVTARKVEEPLQRVPFAVTVITDAADIRETRRFARETQGLNFAELGVRTANTSNIRGVGSFLPLSFEDSSVPVFVDGVPLPLGAIDIEFFDIERIEILRGPQSSVFGRNAQAGVINITTANPTEDHEVGLGVEVGNFEHRRITGLLNGPLSETFAGRFAVQYNTRDGDIPDLNLGGAARDQDILNINGKLRWTPDAKTEVTLGVRFGDYNEEPTQGVLLENPSFPELSLDMPTDLRVETYGGNLNIRRDLGFGMLTSVTGVQYFQSRLSIDDTDGIIFGALTGFPSFLFNNPDTDFRNIEQDTTQISQELRLDGETASGVRWIAGVEYLSARSNYDQVSNSFRPTGLLFGQYRNDFETDSFAAYGEVTVPVSARLEISGGLRVTHEEKKFEARFDDFTGLAFDTVDIGDDDFTLVTGRAAIAYDLAPTVTVFATVARGAKSGGFQLINPAVAFGIPNGGFDSAATWTYEAGSRGRLFDDRVSYSASVFFNDTDDEHVPIFQAIPFDAFVENLDTETYGGELEVIGEVFDGFSISGGLALLQTEITRSDVPGVAVGNEVPISPALSYAVGGRYERAVTLAGADGVAAASVQYQFVGKRAMDPQNSFELDSYDIVNARLGWDAKGFSIYAFADNIFDAVYASNAIFVAQSPVGEPVSFGFPGQPRRYGLGATIRFSGR